MTRFRSTFLLVLVFVALFSYFWIYQKDATPPEPTSDVPAPETYQLAMYKPEDLTEVSWKSASYSATLQNSGDQKWKLTQPTAINADEAKTKAYVDGILAMTGSQKYDAKNFSDSNTGLGSPTLTISVKKKDNSIDLYKFGSKTVDGDYYYVTKDGSNIITLLGSFIVEDLNKDPQTFKPDPSASPSASTGAVPVGSTTPQF